MMYYMLAGLQPGGAMALRCPLTSVYGRNSALFSFFLICFWEGFFSFPPVQGCKETEISFEVKLLIHMKTQFKQSFNDGQLCLQ